MSISVRERCRPIKVVQYVEGKYHVALIDKYGRIKRELEFKNLIPDVGMNSLFTLDTQQYQRFQNVAVGTGNTPPSIADVALVAEVARKQAAQSTGNFEQAVDFSWIEWDRAVVFDYAEANGNLAELGIFGVDGSLMSRQLFLDELGNPTVITKTNNDLLRISYFIRLTGIPVVTYNTIIDINGTNYTFTTENRRALISWKK